MTLIAVLDKKHGACYLKTQDRKRDCGKQKLKLQPLVVATAAEKQETDEKS